MQGFHLTGVKENLSFSDLSKVNEEQRKAAAITQLWVQDVAFAIGKKRGFPVHQPSFARSREYFMCYFDAITKYTKWVEIRGATSLDVREDTHSGELRIGDVMTSVMSLYIGAKAAKSFESLTKLLEKSSDTEVTNFMNFWWSHVNRHEGNTGLQAGPISLGKDGLVEFSIVQYSYTFELNDWRTMFISSHYESFSVYSNGNTFAFDLENYKEFETAIRKKLGSDIHKSIDEAPI